MKEDKISLTPKGLEFRLRIKKEDYVILLIQIEKQLRDLLKKKRLDPSSDEIKNFYLLARKIVSVKYGRPDTWTWYDRAGMKREISSLIKKIDEKIKEMKAEK